MPEEEVSKILQKQLQSPPGSAAVYFGVLLDANG
jgi:hypothetical protein